MSDNNTKQSIYWHIPTYVLCCIILLGLTKCRADFPKDIAEFYYPVNLLDEGLVYHYKSTTNDMDPLDQYWFFKGHQITDSQQLTGQFYDHNKQILQYFRQTINKSGVLMDEYRLYSNDTIADIIPVEVLYNNVYPFQVKDTTSIYLYKLQYVNPADSSINTIVRNRRYSGTTTWEHNGKTYDAIQFNVLEQIQNDRDGVVKIDLKGYEIYAKGIGQVYTERVTQDGTTRIVDQLVDRIPMEAFEVSNQD